MHGIFTSVKRDKDLIRALLLYIEKNQKPPIRQLKHSNFSDREISYHTGLLHQAGFIEAKDYNGDWVIQGLTWQGHDFLDKARDETVWNAAKERVGGKFDKLSLDMLSKVLSEVAMQSLGLR